MLFLIFQSKGSCLMLQTPLHVLAPWLSLFIRVRELTGTFEKTSVSSLSRSHSHPWQHHISKHIASNNTWAKVYFNNKRWSWGLHNSYWQHLVKVFKEEMEISPSVPLLLWSWPPYSLRNLTSLSSSSSKCKVMIEKDTAFLDHVKYKAHAWKPVKLHEI